MSISNYPSSSPHSNTRGIWNETLLIIGSRQDQTPVNPAVLNFVDPQALIDATDVKVHFVTSADWALLWLNDSTEAYNAKGQLIRFERDRDGCGAGVGRR